MVGGRENVVCRQCAPRHTTIKQDVNIDLIVCETERGGEAVKALLAKGRAEVRSLFKCYLGRRRTEPFA